nr:hypothetical protein [Tanacetum cinerariifolium]
MGGDFVAANHVKKPNKLNMESPIVHDATISVGLISYARIATSKQPMPKGESSKFNFIKVDNVFEGKRLAFLVVEYFVKNNWAKYGLKRIMLNAKGFFFFKFDFRAMNTSLLKEDLNRVPILVKFHDVPLEGHSSFTRCLIEVSSDEPLKDSFTIGIPLLDGPGFTKELTTVEYEWKPPRCDKCRIFGHCSDMSSCPKRVVAALTVVTNTSVVNETTDGIQQVVNTKRNNKRSSIGNKIPKGVPVTKGFQIGKEFSYKPKAISTSSQIGGTHGEESSKAGSSKHSNVNVISANKSNSNEKQREKDVVDSRMMKMANNSSPNPFAVLGEDDEEEVKKIWDESVNLNLQKTGTSTPAQTVFDV